MTLTPLDLAAMGERHRPSKINPVCNYEGDPWPCDSRRLLDEVEALRRVVREAAETFEAEGLSTSAEMCRKAVAE